MVYRGNGGNVVVYNNRPEAEGAPAELNAAACKNPNFSFTVTEFQPLCPSPGGVRFRADRQLFVFAPHGLLDERLRLLVPVCRAAALAQADRDVGATVDVTSDGPLPERKLPLANIVPTGHCTPITPQIAPLHRRFGACVKLIHRGCPPLGWISIFVSGTHQPRHVQRTPRFRTIQDRPKDFLPCLRHDELAEPPSSALGGGQWRRLKTIGRWRTGQRSSLLGALPLA